MFSLASITPIRLVLRGQDVHFSSLDILDELQIPGFPILSAIQLQNPTDPRKPLPLVRHLEEKDNSAYCLVDLKTLFGLIICVEPFNENCKVTVLDLDADDR